MRKKSAIARETRSGISVLFFLSLIARSRITTIMSTMISTTPNTLQREKYKEVIEVGMNTYQLNSTNPDF